MPVTIEIIDAAWEGRSKLSPSNVEPEVKDAIEQCIQGLDKGEFRVAEPVANGEWPNG